MEWDYGNRSFMVHTHLALGHLQDYDWCLPSPPHLPKYNSALFIRRKSPFRVIDSQPLVLHIVDDVAGLTEYMEESTIFIFYNSIRSSIAAVGIY